MCTENSSAFTAEQEGYITAMVELMAAQEARQLAIKNAEAATKTLRASGMDPNDVEQARDLMEEGITRSGRGEDDEQVRLMRAAFDDQLKIQEAIANGMSPEEAEFLTQLGVDPRTVSAGITSTGTGGSGEFQF